MNLDIFAGIGGWDMGAVLAEIDPLIGIEFDSAPCRTRAAAEHHTIRADVAQYRVPHPIFVLTGSPPCQAFSKAGKRKGIQDVNQVFQIVRDIEKGRKTKNVAWNDERSALVLEPLRYISEGHATYVALEQVPEVLPLWDAFAIVLRKWGYDVVTGLLNAADYGVPQTRTRAILLARKRELGLGPLSLPEPTHAREPRADFFGSREKWVSMAEALGWLGEDAPARTLCGHRQPRWLYNDPDGSRGRIVGVGFPRKADDNGPADEDGYRARDWRSPDQPAFTLTEKARSWRVNTGRDWKAGGSREDAQTVPLDEPAPTLPAAKGGASIWKLEEIQAHGASRAEDEPAMTITASADNGNFKWTEDRPATTVACDPRLWPPGHKVNQKDRDRHGDEADDIYGDRAGRNSYSLLVEEALVLQSFPWNYPVQGTKTEKFRGIGNAIPPLLAAHCLAAVQGRTL